MEYPYKIFPLGDSAITIDFGNSINKAINRHVIARLHQFNSKSIEGVIELVPAYSSLTVYYNMISVLTKIKTAQSAFEVMKEKIESILQNPVSFDTDDEMLVHIPVCYAEPFAPDLLSICEQKNIESHALIKIHTATIYKIYMLGFLPGFAYMGEVDERISISRKPEPVKMFAGSVGIAGKQTGIYPIESPGGWQIIGRTPWKLFNASRPEPVLLKAGQRVQFYEITEEEYEEMLNAKDDYR